MLFLSKVYNRTLQKANMEPEMDYQEFEKIEMEIAEKSQELKELRERRKEYLDQIEDMIVSGEVQSFKFGPNEFVMQERKKVAWNKKACIAHAVNGMLDVDAYAEGGEYVKSLKRKRVKN
tara:strand:- start:398 stop:757 length:360 start_codon:yes stop_codon:yes gene_type:complete